MKNKINGMKGNGFFPFLIMLVISLLLLKYLVVISFWFSFGIVIFFAALQFIWPGAEVIYKSKGIVIASVLLVVFTVISSYWQTNFFRSYGKTETLKSILDQTLAKNMGDKVEAASVDIWEINKDKASKKFLVYYNDLLVEEKTIQAADTLKKFNKKWNVDLLKDRAEKIEKIKTSEPIKFPINQVQDSIFTKGTYYINVEGKTSFNIVVVPTKHGCARYTLSSKKYNYAIIFSDGEIIQDGPGVIVAYREKPVFKLYSKTGDIVKLVVS